VLAGDDVFQIPFADAASRENAVHVWMAALHMGANPEALRLRMAALMPVAMRLELKSGINGCRLINDAYNNDLAALRIALQFARQQEPDSPLTVILSDIISGGVDNNALYTEVADLLAKARIERLIGVGPAVRMLDDLLPAHVQRAFYADSNALWDNLPHLRFQQEVILLKGARAFAFERIAHRLELKAHQTVLEVNLTAMVHNLHVYTRLLRPGVKIMVMVKAAGYGSGPVEVARLLEYHKADYLGVAYTDEGVELRQAGVQLPILVLNPDPVSFDALVRFNLEPEVYSLKQLDELIAYCSGGRSVRVHVKLDTGMHRLGFSKTDLPLLGHALALNPHLHVASVFSHLVGSDSPLHDAYTHEQADRFRQMSDQLMAHLGYPVLRHLVNTGGIARFPEYHFDMVRLGIGLYGVDGSPVQSELRVVHTLKATISQIKTLKAGMTVGYNRMGVLERDSRVATISVGYADGLLRLAGNGRFAVQVHGKRAPTLGNVCMDMTMIDVTDILEAQEGDEVILFGKSPSVQQLADCLQTIPYEVFTNIAQRVKRVFFQES
jgi:alanine racemase